MRDEYLAIFIHFKKSIETQYSMVIKQVQSDEIGDIKLLARKLE